MWSGYFWDIKKSYLRNDRVSRAATSLTSAYELIVHRIPLGQSHRCKQSAETTPTPLLSVFISPLCALLHLLNSSTLTFNLSTVRRVWLSHEWHTGGWVWRDFAQGPHPPPCCITATDTAFGLHPSSSQVPTCLISQGSPVEYEGPLCGNLPISQMRVIHFWAYFWWPFFDPASPEQLKTLTSETCLFQGGLPPFKACTGSRATYQPGHVKP